MLNMIQASSLIAEDQPDPRYPEFKAVVGDLPFCAPK